MGGGSSMPVFSGARVRTSASSVVPAGGALNVVFGTEVFDTDSYWSVGSPTKFILVPGTYYLFSANIQAWPPSAADYEAAANLVVSDVGNPSAGNFIGPVLTGVSQLAFTMSGVFVAPGGTSECYVALSHTNPTDITIVATAIEMTLVRLGV
jgi:hypothetical protein